MAKGKYKSRKQNRDASQLGEDLVRVRDQLIEEQRRLVEMRERAELDVRLRADLAEAIAARDAVCAPQLQRIADDREVIRAVTRDRAAANRSIRRHSQKVTEWGLRELGAEYFYALVTGNRMRFLEGVHSTNLKGEAVETIQRARGLRTRPVGLHRRTKEGPDRCGRRGGGDRIARRCDRRRRLGVGPIYRDDCCGFRRLDRVQNTGAVVRHAPKIMSIRRAGFSAPIR